MSTETSTPEADVGEDLTERQREALAYGVENYDGIIGAVCAAMLQSDDREEMDS